MPKNNFLTLLRPASWRGVAFEVLGDDAEFGRHTVVHEFVQRDRPFVEDLGRKTRKFKLDAWVCAGPANGFNPWPQRDALIEAVEAGGVGTLVHPFFGVLRGHVLSLAVKQTSTHGGGMVNLSLEFVEAGELDFKTSVIADTYGAVTSAAGAVYTRAEVEFAAVFDVAKKPDFVLADALRMVNQFRATAARAQRVGALVAQVARGNLAAVGVLGGLAGGGSLLAEPLALARAVTGAVRDLQRPGLLFNFAQPTAPAINTPSRNAQRSNGQAMTHLVQAAALARSAELSADLAASSTRYAAGSTALRNTPALITRAEMVANRQAVTNSLTGEVTALSALQMFPETQAALVALRTATVQHMTAEGEHLARTFKTSNAAANSWNGYMQTLPLAYRHYGALTDDVINDRNEIPNPLFIAPRAAVELLASSDRY